MQLLWERENCRKSDRDGKRKEKKEWEKKENLDWKVRRSRYKQRKNPTRDSKSKRKWIRLRSWFPQRICMVFHFLPTTRASYFNSTFGSFQNPSFFFKSSHFLFLFFASLIYIMTANFCAETNSIRQVQQEKTAFQKIYSY